MSEFLTPIHYAADTLTDQDTALLSAEHYEDGLSDEDREALTLIAQNFIAVKYAGVARLEDDLDPHPDEDETFRAIVDQDTSRFFVHDFKDYIAELGMTLEHSEALIIMENALANFKEDFEKED